MSFPDLAAGRGYALFPRALIDPVPLDESGKLYSKQIGGVVQLFYQADDGTVYQLTPTGVGPTPSIHIVVWRPALPSSGDFVQTWAEVEALIALTQGSITVFLEGTCIIPSTADTECFGRVTFSLYTFNISGTTTLEIQDGGRLRNPFTFRTASIHGVATIRPFILLDIPGTICIFREGGNCSLDFGSTVPAISIAGNFAEVAGFEGGGVSNNTGNPALAAIQIEPGLTFLHALIAIAGTAGPPAYPANTIGGDATTSWLQIYDASAAPVTQTNFAGTAIGLPMDSAIGVVYQDGVTTPTTGAGFVQTILDILKRRVTGFGNTASRPVIPTDIDTGGMYFDTDLGIPIWSNGAIYVNASGIAT